MSVFFANQPLTFTIHLTELLVEVDPSTIWIEGIGRGAQRVSMQIVEGTVQDLLRGKLNVRFIEAGVRATELDQVKAITGEALSAYEKGEKPMIAAAEASTKLKLRVEVRQSDVAAANIESGIGAWQASTQFMLTGFNPAA